MQYAQYNNDYNSLFISACSNGYTDIAMEIYEKHGHTCDQVALSNTIINVAQKGYLDIVKFLHKELGVTACPQAIEWAGELGHVDVVQYLHEKMEVPCTLHGMDLAYIRRQPAVVKYLHEVGGITPQMLMDFREPESRDYSRYCRLY